MRKILDHIIQNKSIYTVYQPIVSLINGETIGYESLTRGPKDSGLESPLDLICAAESYNCLFELEYLMRECAIERAIGLDNEQFLFINVDPNIINDENFTAGLTKKALAKNARNTTKIVFEITERTAIKDYKIFKRLLKHFRDQNYQIAIDDVGAGYSGLKTIQETEPEFIKIDMELIRDIDKHEFKQAMINALVTLTKTTTIKLIAEGIETKDELRTLITLGVGYGQGYYIGKPCCKILPIEEKVRAKILKYKEYSLNTTTYSCDYHYIGSIASKGITVTPNTKCSDVKAILDQRYKEGLCVLEDDHPIGLIMKNHLDEKLSMQYGHALFAGKSINHIMDKTPLIVDYYMPVNKVMKSAMNRKMSNVYDSIIVMKGTVYFGMVTIKKLIEFAAAIEKKYAKELNPLTALPGNPVIQRVLDDLITISDDYRCLVYVDLDHFKYYNDIYGFSNGDAIILYLGKLLKENAKKYFSHLSFVGHIGGDDFVMLIQSDISKIRAFYNETILTFNDNIAQYYTPGLPAVKKDRHGHDFHFEGVYLTFAALYGNMAQFETVPELAKTMAQIKEEGKSIKGHSLIIKSLHEKKPV